MLSVAAFILVHPVLVPLSYHIVDALSEVISSFLERAALERSTRSQPRVRAARRRLFRLCDEVAAGAGSGGGGREALARLAYRLAAGCGGEPALDELSGILDELQSALARRPRKEDEGPPSPEAFLEYWRLVNLWSCRRGLLPSRGMVMTPLPVAELVVEIAWRVGGWGRDAVSTPSRVLEPGCGPAPFLLAVFRRLLEDGVAPHEAALRLVGIDDDAASLLTAKAVFLAEAARIGAGELPLALAGGDFLRNPPDGEKWDLIVMNPPYLNETRGNAALFRRLRGGSSLRAYAPRTDLCYQFLHLSLDLLGGGGVLAALIDAYLPGRSAGELLLHRIRRKLALSVELDFQDLRFFEEAPGLHSSALIGRSRPFPAPRRRLAWCVCSRMLTCEAPRRGMSRACLLAVPPDAPIPSGWRGEGAWSLRSEWITQGVVAPQTRTGRKLVRSGGSRVLPRDDPVFVFHTCELEGIELTPDEKPLFVPYFWPSQLENEGVAAGTPWRLLYMDAASRRLVEESPERYPFVHAHLRANAGRITSSNGPFGLHRPRRRDVFAAGAKLLVNRQSPGRITALATERECFVGEGTMVVRVPGEGILFHRALAALLRSLPVLGAFILRKRKGTVVQVDKKELAAFSFPPLAEAARARLARFAPVDRTTPAELERALDETAGELLEFDREHLDGLLVRLAFLGLDVYH